jgi:hypothetical protein
VGREGLVSAHRFRLHPELSVCERPIGVAEQSGAQHRKPGDGHASDPAGLRATASATRCQMPLSVTGFAPTLGMNGQNSLRPNKPEQLRQHQSTNTAATTRPDAACTPRLRVLGEEASTSVSSARTTVALLANIAGPACRTATRARRGDSRAAQLLPIAGDEQQA